MDNANISDNALMVSLQRGDTKALCQLIERWQDRLLSFTYRYVQSESIARDLVEETFIRLYQSNHHFDPKRSFSSWLFGIAANLCRNQMRWWARRPEYPSENLPEIVETTTPADVMNRQESDAALAGAVRQLPHDLRVTLILYYFEDLSYHQIAEVVGCSVRGVESRLYRARKSLLRKLQLESALLQQDSASRWSSSGCLASRVR